MVVVINNPQPASMVREVDAEVREQFGAEGVVPFKYRQFDVLDVIKGPNLVHFGMKIRQFSPLLDQRIVVFAKATTYDNVYIPIGPYALLRSDPFGDLVSLQGFVLVDADGTFRMNDALNERTRDSQAVTEALLLLPDPEAMPSTFVELRAEVEQRRAELISTVGPDHTDVSTPDVIDELVELVRSLCGPGSAGAQQ
ncbi:MAG: hypothetical protein R3F61_20035 [Myxococcota bacterium]